MAHQGEENTTPDTAIAEIHGEPLSDLDQQLWDIFAATASAHPDREAIVSLWQPADGSRVSEDANLTARSECLRCSYGNLRDSVEHLADTLEKLGVGVGMHVAAVLWNCAEWGFLLWACVKIGAVFIPIDPRVTDDVCLMLESISPRVLVVQDTESAVLLDGQMSRPQYSLLRVHCGSGSVDGWISLGQLLARDSTLQGLEGLGDTDDDQGPRRANGNTPALIVFTSGTTGKSKGCPHTNRNLVSQTNNYDANADPSFVDRWLVHTPVCHVFAINNALRAWRHGGTVVFAAKSFHIDATLTALVQEKCTVMSATPTLVRALLSHSSFPSSRDLNLSIVSISGTMIGPEHMRLCREGLGARDAIQAYGMTEGAPIISWSRRDEMLVDGYHAGVGKVLPGAAVRVCRPGTRQVLSRMQVGELHIAGTSVIHNYLCDDESEQREERFYNDNSGRWLKTGDQAMIDNKGVVYILGRYNDLIIRGGENINPLKIESVLAEIPGLLQVLVVGVPDDIAGQVPVAIVKITSEVSKGKVMDKAKLLGPQYALDAVYTLEELGIECVPVTSIGKPKKAILADIVTKQRLANQTKTLKMKKKDEVSLLETQLREIWDQLVGVRPSKTDDIFSLADSITLLRYCDAVLRVLGRQLYLQDLSKNATIEKQAKLLVSRDAPIATETEIEKRSFAEIYQPEDGCISLPKRGQDYSPNQNPLFGDRGKYDLLAAAQEQIKRFGLDGSDVEDVIPIRGSMYRTIVGQRPQSYRIRLAFRIRDATISQIYNGLFRWIASRPLLRTVLLGTQGLLYHTVVRHSQHLFQKLVSEVEVRTEKEAKEVYEDSSEDTHSLMFMFSAIIIKIKETGQYLLRITYSHSIADALTLLPWHRDLDRLIHNSSIIIPAQTPYRLFADLLTEYQDSLPAQRAVSFHVQRLRGISRYKSALWPKQLSPGMMIGNDRSSFYAAEREAVRDQIWKGEWQAKADEFQFPRRSRIVRLPNMAKMRNLYNLEPVLFTKCALTLFNVLQTKSSVALFTSWESARSWPFVPEWIANSLPPAMSIDGPTVEWILNMFEIKREETLIDLIQRMVLEQEQIRRHEHAPWEKVVQELREEGSVAIDASFRQSFVWDVSMGVAASRGFRSDFETLEPVARGLFWNAFMVNGDNLFFIASWDTAQLNAEQVDGYCDGLADVMRRLANEENWGRKIGDVFFEL
ncbi:uncharacterized protein TRIVIDRAFT_37084 [Trichoderma virens Gv29-8]|uniref:AMP-dependent synthetase/ligase domain-containing protein n=1 Tax=Hypocrea virens (strain Gv29-8 / FGSC 10586) TaxID=413071 RepID=G9MN92_HYPVG|nr:uncharacterized protein TRIVIDRAFT_37084 [Trichoderma virens Gv29-8]EHK23348.1 hypothetical protein TRIVIDRAFT_37084 [Trichoderma virens Gv29-8]UKZ49651.1 hypothetical protein TrVGV298_003898 [Trichoderma virens]